MDLNKQNIKPKSETEELEFNVMPKELHSAAEAKPEVHRISPDGFAAAASGRNYLRIALIVLGVIVVLGGGVFLVIKRISRTEPEAPASPNPIQAPEADSTNKDSDDDGLSDAEESRLALDASSSDTDGDGLADGDEVNIYLSDPMLSDTDGDSFDDGREVARGYSPIVKTTEKASAQEIKSWSDLIFQHTLHEPTTSTLKLKAQDLQTQTKVAYTNTKYRYSVQIPAILTFREQDEGRLVGLYISGTNPEDEILTDPINMNVGTKITGQSLKDWAMEQYQSGTYEFLQERDIGALKAIRLVGVKDESCARDITFFAQDNTVIVITWTCNQNLAFGELYEQIVASFKFN